MANVITPYNPIFYAQEALMLLENTLGIAARIHRGYDAERKSAEKGDTISIKKPSELAVTDGGTDTAGDLYTENVDISLSNWKQVRFKISDKELAYTSEKIISDHISPAVYALASHVDSALAGLYSSVPWFIDSGTIDADAIVDTRKVLRDNAGDAADSQNIHFAVDSTLEAAFLKDNVFQNASVTGQGQNAALFNGSLGQRFNTECFVNQSLKSHTSGTVVSAGTDVAGTVNGAHSKGGTSVVIADLSLVETLKAGDTFVIAGNTQRYVVTADVTLSSGAGTIAIFPALKADVADTTVITFEDGSGASIHADSYYSNMMFHKNFAALAFAPLPSIGNELGAKISTITDPRTGISIRARMAYKDSDSSVYVTLDILYGVKCLDPNLAVQYRRDK